MKKLLAICLMAGGASVAFAGEDIKKMDTNFSSLDNDDNGYISQEEADDNNVWDHFSKIDTDNDNQLSHKEFSKYVEENPDMVEQGEHLTIRN